MSSAASRAIHGQLDALKELSRSLKTAPVSDAATLLDQLLAAVDQLAEHMDAVSDSTEDDGSHFAIPESVYKTMGDVVPDFLWSCGPDGSPIYANSRWTEYTGLPARNDMPMDVIHHPEDFPGLAKIIGQAVADRAAFNAEYRLRRHDGVYRWFMARAVPVKDSSGEISQWVGTTTDIHERKLAQQALTQSYSRLRTTEERFAATFEQVAVGIAHLTPNGDWLLVNQKLCDIVGYSREELLNLDYLDIIHPHDHEIDSRQLQQIFAGEISHYSLEKRFICNDKTVIWTNNTVSLARDLDGTPDYFIAVVEDITERKNADWALAQRARMSALMADLGDALTRASNLRKTLMRCSNALLMHLDAALVRIWTLADDPSVLHLQASSGLYTHLDGNHARIAVGQIHIGRVALHRKSYTTNLAQEDPRVEDHAWAVRESIVGYACYPLIVDAHLVGVFAVFSRHPLTDVACETLDLVADAMAVGIQRKNAEDEVTALNTELERRVVERTAQLEAAVKELDAFSYTVSHDLRAPLRAIDGFSQALDKDFGDLLPAQAKQYLERVRSNAQKMARLIDDLLAFSHLGRQHLNIQPAHISSIVNEVVAELRLAYANRKINVTIGAMPVFHCDTSMIRQVFTNLLSNAFKYTGRCATAEIEVDYTHENGEHVFTVKDNGVGFDMQYAGKLFAVFQRLHRAEEFDGVGVGLAIVERIVHRHGGRVWAEAAPDEGATFHFTLEGESQNE